MQLYVDRVADLSAADYRACHRCCLRDRGLMQPLVERARREADESLAFRALDDGGRLLGWGLVRFDERGPYGNVYVRRAARRRGIGAALLSAMTARCPGVRMSPSTDLSAAFARAGAIEVVSDLGVGMLTKRQAKLLARFDVSLDSALAS